jgi:hypothetical protein
VESACDPASSAPPSAVTPFVTPLSVVSLFDSHAASAIVMRMAFFAVATIGIIAAYVRRPPRGEPEARRDASAVGLRLPSTATPYMVHRSSRHEVGADPADTLERDAPRVAAVREESWVRVAARSLEAKVEAL